MSLRSKILAIVQTTISVEELSQSMAAIRQETIAMSQDPTASLALQPLGILLEKPLGIPHGNIVHLVTISQTTIGQTIARTAIKIVRTLAGSEKTAQGMKMTAMKNVELLIATMTIAAGKRISELAAISSTTTS
jgi:hypothetical protein